MAFLHYFYLLILFSLFPNLITGSPRTRQRDTVKSITSDPTYTNNNPNPNHRIFHHYTALGDRIAAGVGFDYPSIEKDTAIDSCKRSGYAYSLQFVNESGPSIELDNFNFPACDNDHDSPDIARQIESGVSLSPLPRVWSDFGQPDLVSISVGALETNGWSQIREQCIYSLYEMSSKSENYTAECYAAIDNVNIWNARLQYEDLFRQALTHDLAPNQEREVYVMGLPQFFSMDIQDSCPDAKKTPPDEFKKELNKVVTGWNDKLRGAAQSVGAFFVSVDEKFERHRICDKEPWVHTNVSDDLLFPTMRGFTAMKDAFAEVALQVRIHHSDDG